MNNDDAARVLRVLAAAYPSYPLTADSTALYLEILRDNVVEPQTGRDAVATWILEKSNFPKPNELLLECQIAARALANRRAERKNKDCPLCMGNYWADAPNGTGVYPCPECWPEQHAKQIEERRHLAQPEFVPSHGTDSGWFAKARAALGPKPLAKSLAEIETPVESW